MEEIYFWIKGREIWSCLYKKFKNGYFKVYGSENLVKKCASEEEARKELERLRKQKIK